jgi:integrase
MHIELAASAYIHRDQPVPSLQTLASLVDVNAFTEVLRYYLEHNNAQPTQFTRDLAKALILIAKYWVGVDQAQLDQLKGLHRRLGPERSGLTEKNRAALRQLDDDRNKALLILLPQRLFEEARRKDHGDVRAAVAFQVGLAIELLWMAPMRMGNLINLRLDRHVVRPGGTHGPVHLVVPGTETKNGEEIEYPLPTESRELLDEYLKKFHPTIAPAGSVWLFPSQGGQRKAQQTLSQQIVETVKERTGLRLTPHQFRHIAAKFLLDADPGNFEAARRLLGHRNMKTTTNFYTGLQTRRAAQHYDAILSQERERLSVHVLDNRKPRK